MLRDEVKVDTCIIVIGKYTVESPMTEVLVYDSFLRTSLISRSTATSVFEIPQSEWSAQKDSAITLSGKSDAEGCSFRRFRRTQFL